MFLRSIPVWNGDRRWKGNKKPGDGTWLPGLFVPPHPEAEVQEVRKFKFKPRRPGCKECSFVNVKKDLDFVSLICNF